LRLESNRRTGKWRVRFRRGRFSCYLPMPEAADFAAAYAAAVANGAKPQALDMGTARTISGSIDATLVSYYKLVFPRLKPSTRAMRRNILERFRVKHGRLMPALCPESLVLAVRPIKSGTYFNFVFWILPRNGRWVRYGKNPRRQSGFGRMRPSRGPPSAVMLKGSVNRAGFQ
jgi:hypothetical protein